MNRSAFLMLGAAAWLGCASDPQTTRTPADPAPAAAAPAGAVAPAAPAAAESAQKPACVVTQATSEPAGLEEERRWLSAQYPGWKKTSQSLGTTEDGRLFDYVSVETPDGVVHEVCFDITSFFGKW